MSDPVLRPRFCPAKSRLPLHPRPITFQESDVVTQEQEFGNFQFALGGSLNALLRFIRAVQIKITIGDVYVSKSRVRINRYRFIGFLDALFILTRALGREPRLYSVG